MGKVPVTRKERAVKPKNNRIISQCHAKVNESFDTASVDFDEYQNASLYGTKYGDTSKWLLKELLPLREKGKLYSLLDVGALAHNYTDVKWIQAVPIDLRPRVPGIVRADFLEYSSDSLFDVVCLSLVLNFVGDPVDRGRMLRKAFDMATEGGFVLVVLPKACTYRSRFMTDEHFQALCKYIGLTLVKHHISKKLVYYLFRKDSTPTGSLKPKEPNIQAAGFNNFKIRL